MSNVSILGCGWLGRPLAISLLKKGFSLKGSTTSRNNIKELKAIGIIPFLVDISSDEKQDAFLDSNILIIAITSKNSEDYKKFILQIEKSRVKKVLFISATSVYPKLNKVYTEKDNVLETPLAKIEQLFRSNSHFKTTIIRFAGLFGGNRKPGNWFQKKIIPQPEGFVNMIHQEDCIEIIEKVIARNAWNETFNACSNHHPTRRAFYTNARKKLGLEEPIFEENDVISYKIISSEKVQKVLGYQFKHDNLLDL